MERSISSYNFDLCITFKLDSKTERVMNILMKEKFSLPSDEKLPIEVNLESTDQSVLQSSEVHLKTFREFRPVRIKIELSTGQRGYYELPVGVITPMNPLSHLFSIITSIFLDCYNFITTSPFSEENVKIILDKYMPMLGANQAFFLDKYENLFLCHTINNEPLINIDLLRSVLHKNSNSMFFETNEIEGIKSIFRTSTNSTDTQLHIVFCFSNPLMEHFSQVGLPIVALCTTFVYQLSLLHRTSQKYTSLIDMLTKSKVFSIYKYYKLEGRLEKNSPDFAEILTQQEAREIASTSKPGELNIWHGKNKVAYTFTSNDGATINILAENTEPINRQITDVSAGLNATYAFSGQLNYAKLDLSETPKLFDGEEFLKKYGLSSDKPFIEHVHINDREKLLAIGKEMPAHNGSDFIANSVQSIMDLNGSEQRYFIPETLLSSSIDPERSKNFMFEYKPDNCSIRLIDSHGFAHWFIVYGNHDIGFIFDAGDFLSTLIPPIPLRALSNPPSTVTIWGVVIETDQVVSVFEMPTIWDALSIDKDTPFSYFPKFFRDPSPEIEQRIQDVRDGVISSYSAVVQILRPGSILRKGRLSVAKYGSSLICAFFDLEEYRETYQRVHEQCQLKSFLIKVGQVAVWRFNDSYDKTAQNKLIIGESKLLTLNWGFVDNELDDENTKIMFTTRMRNAMDLGHAFEIDLQIQDGRYFAFRGRTTAPHVVTGLLVDVTKVYSSPCNRLVNGKTDVEETVKAISEIKQIFEKVDRSKLSNEQISNVDEVIHAARDLEEACRGLK
ncbi:hypothetical protein TVAG_191760 [Trichomonas vaginalis G3]|uniref:Uncharacterized protein n=1 Tax=Trichomonas vaginalis (strain ATCC PRA-98 / G3) TaxID=412133 RepID=A2EQN1_TRIV3|nr:phosphorelay sensor kinase protein [Trichomonas vaginalis G3]EAY05078.1 hypothetical protein TVAG_191760 [Trichomonas vaginalis G3]KAI5489010.1 phosphorelay sensor kinase protein [Trichomonas vaginalis G3]|eukprot:XP_001317301.1 hypothetical protein [Trichomonas vaginalis G3]